MCVVSPRYQRCVRSFTICERCRNAANAKDVLETWIAFYLAIVASRDKVFPASWIWCWKTLYGSSICCGYLRSLLPVTNITSLAFFREIIMTKKIIFSYFNSSSVFKKKSNLHKDHSNITWSRFWPLLTPPIQSVIKDY